MRVLVDENFKQLDHFNHRLVYCHVVASDTAINEFLVWHRDYFLRDSMRYKSRAKVHFTEEDTATKQVLVEMVKDLELTIKFYIAYFKAPISGLDKLNILKWTIGEQLQNEKQSQFIVEESSHDYDDINKHPQVNVVAANDVPETALADIALGVMARKLEGAQDSANERWYKMIYPRIRVQTIRFSDGTVRRLTRGSKISTQ